MSQRTWTYSLFGFEVRSNASIPGIPPSTQNPSRPDIDIRFGVSPYGPGEARGPERLSYTSKYTDEAGEPALQIWGIADGALIRFAYSDGHEFWMDSNGEKVWALWPGHSSIEQVTPYLLGPVLGVLLRYRGITCLHASAAAHEGRAVAFVGAAGAGKSTTAAALAARGWVILCDDITALRERDGRFCATPAYPSLNLWPDSVRLLYGTETALPSIFPNWEKRRLLLRDDDNSFAREALPLAAIYILEELDAGGEMKAETLQGQQALLALVANTYATHTISPELRAREFALLGKLVSAVPIRRLAAKRDPADLTKFCQFVLQDFDHLLSRL